MSMLTLFSLTLAAIATVVMIVNIVFALRLRRALSGGEVGSKWRLLTMLLLCFLVAYVASPTLLFLGFGVETMATLAFGVFLLGALFVWIVIGILRDTLSFLDLLREG